MFFFISKKAAVSAELSFRVFGGCGCTPFFRGPSKGNNMDNAFLEGRRDERVDDNVTQWCNSLILNLTN